MTDIVSVDQLIGELRALSARQANGVKQVHELELKFDEASRTLEWAKANAMLSATGSNVEEKKARATLAVKAEQTAYDVAKSAFNYAKTLSKSLEMQQMSTQSQLSAVRATYMVGAN
jgi:hypothetical protein